MPRASLLLALVGCVPQYYVADVHNGVQTKCAFDFQGQPTNDCHEESADNTYGNDDEAYGTPDPAEVRKVKRQLDAPVATRPVPTDAMIAHAMTSPGVSKAVDLCRAAYAPDATALDVKMTVAPTGEILALSTNAPKGQFAECTTRALRTANIPAYDGSGPLHFAQTLTL